MFSFNSTVRAAIVLGWVSSSAWLCTSTPIARAQTPRTEDAGPDADAADPTPGTLTRPPTVLEARPPALPSDLPPLSEAAEVVLELTIDAEGRPDNVQVVRGIDPIRDAAATRALSAFLFTPAEIDGAPAAVVIEYRFAFEPAKPPAPEVAPPPAAAAPAPTGVLEGRVLERGTRRPLIGARVTLPELGLDAFTDAQGRFRFESVPVGTHGIHIEDPDHQELREKEAVGAGTRTEVTFYVQALGAARADLVATGKRIHKEVSHHRIDAELIATAPGTQGDAIKVIQNLPGAARAPFGTGAIVLRGGYSSETFVDGHFVPNVFHFGGLRSTVGNGLLQEVTLIPGNYGARYGNANAGIVDVALRAPAHDGAHGFAQVDLFDTSLFLEGPVSEHTSVALGGRRSYIDALLPAFLSSEDLETFSVAPVYYDYQAMLDYDHGQDSLRAQLVGGSDRMVLLQENPETNDPAVRGAFDIHEQWLSTQVHYKHRFGADTDNALSLGYLIGDSERSLGEQLKLQFSYHIITLRNDFRHRLSPNLQLRAGPDLRLGYLHFDVVAPQPAKEGDPALPLSAQPIRQAEGTMLIPQPALWAEFDWQLGRLLLVPGLRIEHFSRTGRFGGDTLAHPRLSSRLELGWDAALKAAVGSYSRATEIDERHQAFGNRELSPSQSIHYSVGAEKRLLDGVLLDATGFYRQLFDQIVAVDDPSMRYDNVGRGRAYGLELLAKYDGARLRAQAAYTLMRSERSAGPAEPYRLFELDQTHNLNLLAQYRLLQTWELGARFRYVTGNPETPYEGAIYDSDADAFVPVPGALFSRRQASFHQLDLRIDKHFIFDTWRLTAYLDIQNAYNRKNPEATQYNYDYTDKSTLAGLPLIPSIGVKGAF
ncbi:MAG: TonB-dependent receptor [Myxococcales bacterium]|nr:TonB-dependent receptor [Myxococcales bacterium]